MPLSMHGSESENRRLNSTLPKAKDLYIYTSFCIYTICCVYIFGGRNMPTLTLSIPKDLKKKMDELPEINWPEVLRTALEKRAKALLKFEEMYNRGEI